MSRSISHARIRLLLELIEQHEQAGTPLPAVAIDADADAAKAELTWLDRQALARLSASRDDTSAYGVALTPFGRGTLALMRGDA